MINRVLCFIAVFVMEAFIANTYYDMLFESRVNKRTKHVCFFVAYIMLFFFGSFESPSINLAAFSFLNFFVAYFCYKASLRAKRITTQ